MPQQGQAARARREGQEGVLTQRMACWECSRACRAPAARAAAAAASPSLCCCSCFITWRSPCSCSIMRASHLCHMHWLCSGNPSYADILNAYVVSHTAKDPCAVRATNVCMSQAQGPLCTMQS